MDAPGQMGGFGRTDPVVSDRVCVVYDPTSGEIHHTHRVVTLEGGTEPSEKEIGDLALSLARSNREIETRTLEVLHVAGDALEPGRAYTVEPKTKSLIVKA